MSPHAFVRRADGQKCDVVGKITWHHNEEKAGHVEEQRSLVAEPARKRNVCETRTAGAAYVGPDVVVVHRAAIENDTTEP